jgi:2-dehydro-3-deoxygalactonokinase
VSDACIAIDWGTTNRRAYLLAADGAVRDTIRDDRGVLAMAADDYPRDIAAFRRRWGMLPVIAVGMVGSTRGWHEAAYVAAPAGLDALAAACLRLPDDIAIVPGVALTGARADVMRGEEVQALGAVAAGLVPADALLAQPGTHNKWIALRGGRITDIATAMTGELFSLVKGHGILAGMLDGAVADGDAFRAGIARGAGARDLATALFEVRARVLLGTLPADDAAAFASGVLIGADVGARGDVPGATVHLLAIGGLADLYAAAVRACGGTPATIDSHAAFAAGAHALWKIIR